MACLSASAHAVRNCPARSAEQLQLAANAVLNSYTYRSKLATQKGKDPFEFVLKDAFAFTNDVIHQILRIVNGLKEHVLLQVTPLPGCDL